MLLKIFAILDAKVGAYAQPFYGRSLGEGERAFQDIFTSEDPRYNHTPYRQSPADFFLYHIGEYDDETGLITPCAPQSLAQGSSFIS